MRAWVDADSMVYRAGFGANAEHLDRVAIKKISDYLMKILLDDMIEDIQVVLSTRGKLFREDYAVTATYKGNREGMVKPIHYDLLRSHLVDHWDAFITDGEEADDYISYSHYALHRTDPASSIIVSIDKDLDNTPGHHWNWVKGEKYYVTEDQAVRNFWQQVLMGDRVDNIVGLPGVGKVKAKRIIDECATERDMYRKCVELYTSPERVYENAILLHIRRYPNELWTPPQ